MPYQLKSDFEPAKAGSEPFPVRILKQAANGLGGVLTALAITLFSWLGWLAVFGERYLRQSARENGGEESGAFHGAYVFTFLGIGLLTLLLLESLRLLSVRGRTRAFLSTTAISVFFILPPIGILWGWLVWYSFPPSSQDQLGRAVVILMTPAVAAWAWTSVMRERPLWQAVAHGVLCLCAWLVSGRLAWSWLGYQYAHGSPPEVSDEMARRILPALSSGEWRHAFRYFRNAPMGVVLVALASFMLTWMSSKVLGTTRSRSVVSLLIGMGAAWVAVSLGFNNNPALWAGAAQSNSAPPSGSCRWMASNDPSAPAAAEFRDAWFRNTQLCFNHVLLRGLPEDVREIQRVVLTQVTSSDGKVVSLPHPSLPLSGPSFTPDRMTVTGGKAYWRFALRLPIIPELAKPGPIKVEGKLQFIRGRPLFECSAANPEITSVPGCRIAWDPKRFPPDPGSSLNTNFTWSVKLTKWSPGSTLTGGWWEYSARPVPKRDKHFRYPSWPITFSTPAPFPWTFWYHAGLPEGQGRLYYQQLDYYTLYWAPMGEKEFALLPAEDGKQKLKETTDRWMSWWNSVRMTAYEPMVPDWADFCLYLTPPPQSEWSLRSK